MNKSADNTPQAPVERDPRWAAVVARSRPEAVEPTDLVDWARQHMAAFKAPKRVVVVDDLPVNAGGKVVKAELRRRLAGSG